MLVAQKYFKGGPTYPQVQPAQLSPICKPVSEWTIYNALATTSPSQQMECRVCIRSPNVYSDLTELTIKNVNDKI